MNTYTLTNCNFNKLPKYFAKHTAWKFEYTKVERRFGGPVELWKSGNWKVCLRTEYTLDVSCLLHFAQKVEVSYWNRQSGYCTDEVYFR